MSSTIVKALKDNEFLQKFVSQTHIDCNDPHYWHQLLSCSFDFGRVNNAKVVESSLEPYLTRLALNNSQSMNTGSLVRVLIDRVGKLKTNKKLEHQDDWSKYYYNLFQAFNSLYLLRCICKYYIETVSEEKLVNNFTSKCTTSNISTNQQSPNSVNSDVNVEVENKTVHSTQNIISGETTLEQLITILMDIMIEIHLCDATYQLHVESINLLLILLSNQMYTTLPSNKSIIYRIIMDKKNHVYALKLTNSLLLNFINQCPVPEEPGSIIIGLASGLWNVLTLGYGRQDPMPNGEGGASEMPILAHQSLLLLNALTNHFTSDYVNLYRNCIINCQNHVTKTFKTQQNQSKQHIGIDIPKSNAPTMIQDQKQDLQNKPQCQENDSPSQGQCLNVDFKKLQNQLCRFLHNDQAALLLYLLLNCNQSFRGHIFTDTNNLDQLIVPILKVLYTNLDRGLHHIYMVLIILLILSQEILFNEAIHEIHLKNVSWYTEKSLNDITLGSLITLIIVRSIQINTFRIKDVFLHSNLYATLANLSSYFKNLHPSVCQRMVDVLGRLLKRYARQSRANHGPAQSSQSLHDESPEKSEIIEIVTQDSQKTATTMTSTEQLNPAIENFQNNHEVQTGQDQSERNLQSSDQQDTNSVNRQKEGNTSTNDTSVSSTECAVAISMDDNEVERYGEVIIRILEVLKNCLQIQIRENSDLIYTLLYRRDLFIELNSMQEFKHLASYIVEILNFFYERVHTTQGVIVSVVEVKSIIDATLRNWPQSKLKAYSDLHFFYVEDERPEDFFIPYVWTRIFYSAGINWKPERIVLFNQDTL